MGKVPGKKTDNYWAEESDLEILHSKLSGLNEDWYEYLQETGIAYVAQRSYRAYYGSHLNSSQDGALFGGAGGAGIERGGKKGEIAKTKANHFRNVILHAIQLATSTQPAFKSVAVNNDYKSQAQAMLSDNVWEYYYKEYALNKLRVDTLETAYISGEGFAFAPWNDAAGDPVIADETGKEVLSGDLEYHGNLSTFDVARDVESRVAHIQDHSWVIVRFRVNKWDLVAAYPKSKADILGSTNVEDTYNSNISGEWLRASAEEYDSDQIQVFTFLHKKSPAMPKGRATVFVNGGILDDQPFDYDKYPLYRVAAGNVKDSCVGYSPAFDLIAIQHGLDICTTAVMTNNANNAIQKIWTKKNDPLTVDEIKSDMVHLQSDEKPEGINLTASAKETYNLRTELKSEIETLSGINSTVRGQPPTSLKSGAALALVVSQAVEFGSMMEGSLTEFMEELATDTIINLQNKSTSPRLIEIMGKGNRPFAKEFIGSDISLIRRVIAQTVNPLSKTISGRLELARELSERGIIKDPGDYVEVLMTGRVDGITQGTAHEQLSITEENEALQGGEEVQVILFENHPLHIKEHTSLLYSPNAKKDAELTSRVLGHIQQHLDNWRRMDPAMLAVLGIQPMPMGQGPGLTPPQNSGPPPGGPPPGPGPQSAPISAPPSMLDGPNMPNLPNMPVGSPQGAVDAYESTLPQIGG
jgi:hypothetical protein